MAKSIFELGDKFGVESPFGDWMEERKKELEAAREKQETELAINSLIVPNYKRIIFYGGSRKDDDLFGRAADNVIKDYTDVKTEKFHIVAGGQSIVDRINSFETGTLQSVDFVCHGGPTKLYFKVDEYDDGQNLYMDDETEQEDGVRYWGNLFSSDTNEFGADLTEINFGVFTDSAKVEMLGCNAAKIDESNGGNNFARKISTLLSVAGKVSAVSVGHLESANPNAHTTLSGDDYRHGIRRIYHAGEILFRTRLEGRIPATMINKYLNKKLQQGRSYDGSKEKTW